MTDVSELQVVDAPLGFQQIRLVSRAGGPVSLSDEGLRGVRASRGSAP